jgi:hypothetical protein
MSLENAVQRLACAVEQGNPAVAEIIRQRDYWKAEAETQRSQKERYEKWYRDRGEENVRLGRVIYSLRGVITRMKRQRTAGA